MVRRQMVSLALQLLLFVLFFHFFGLPLIRKYQQHQVNQISSGQIDADVVDDADAAGDGDVDADDKGDNDVDVATWILSLLAFIIYYYLLSFIII